MSDSSKPNSPYDQAIDECLWNVSDCLKHSRPYVVIVKREDPGEHFVSYAGTMTDREAMDLLGRIEVLKSMILDDIAAGSVQEDEEGETEDA